MPDQVACHTSFESICDGAKALSALWMMGFDGIMMPLTDKTVLSLLMRPQQMVVVMAA
jgi:hypothetical protein